MQLPSDKHSQPMMQTMKAGQNYPLWIFPEHTKQIPNKKRVSILGLVSYPTDRLDGAFQSLLALLMIPQTHMTFFLKSKSLQQSFQRPTVCFPTKQMKLAVTLSPTHAYPNSHWGTHYTQDQSIRAYLILPRLY